ncbi:hypothetical protein [Herbaspirillum sp. ST 5-3]|uniref:hypothetical protein n=1 Tax=Oxalobacteraceae TaxID=75682 RepID=UPI0010A4F777|nr:hypothetical protein [Herbaspirillum sp. ST 5-3]
MAQNIIFGYPNRTDEGTLSGGSWQASLPLANLQSRVFAKVARSTDATEASTTFTIDLGQERTIGVLGLVGHNISVDGTVRLRGAATQAELTTNPMYDSGYVNGWPSGMVPLDLLEWEDNNFWLGTLSPESRAGYQSPFTHTFSRTTTRWWEIDISDTTNADGYLQIGRLFLADTWQPAYNMSYGLSLRYEDQSQIETSLGGVDYFDGKTKYRITRFDLDWLSDEEAYTRIVEMQRMLGISGELLIVPDPDDVTNMPRRAYVGRLKSIGELVHDRFGNYRTAVEVKELI